MHEKMLIEKLPCVEDISGVVSSETEDVLYDEDESFVSGEEVGNVVDPGLPVAV